MRRGGGAGAARRGLTLEARVVGIATAGGAKVPAPTGLTPDRIDAIELDEAFPARALPVLRDLGILRNDPNGGAIAAVRERVVCVSATTPGSWHTSAGAPHRGVAPLMRNARS